MRPTIEELKRDLEQLKKQVEKTRQERVARGLPPDPPKPFVPLAMGWTLFNKCKPLLKYATNYAKLCRDSKSIVEIPSNQKEWIRSFGDYALLLSEVNTDKVSSLYAKTASGAVYSVYNRLLKTNEYETVNQLVRDLTMSLQFTTIESNPTHRREITSSDYASFWELGNEKEEELFSEFMEEVERLKDKNYFNQKLTELLAYYESIKHLY